VQEGGGPWGLAAAWLKWRGTSNNDGVAERAWGGVLVEHAVNVLRSAARGAVGIDERHRAHQESVDEGVLDRARRRE
jgi:hypothetical protein